MCRWSRPTGLGVTVRFNSGGEPVWAELLVGRRERRAV